MDCIIEFSTVTQIYTAYVQGMASIGAAYGKSVTDDYDHWARTAKLCMKNGINPVRFVNAQFMALAPTLRGTLTPRMLHTPVGRVLQAYASVSPDPCDYPGMHADMASRLAREARGAITETSVLSDPDQPFTAWFRVARLPVLEGRARDWYYEAALAEYDDDPKLREFLHKEKLDGRFTVSQRPGLQ